MRRNIVASLSTASAFAALALGAGTPAWAVVVASPACNAASSPCTTSGAVTGAPSTSASSSPVNVGDGGTGSLTITGGTYYAQPLDVGVASTDSGSVSQTGGTLNDDAIIGDAGTGSYDNNNGTHNVSGNLILGNQSTGNGTYTVEGDSAQTNVIFSTITESPNGALIVGNAGTGSFTQGTGSDTPAVSVAGGVVLGSQSGSTGSYNLNSGTLTIQTGNGGNGTAGTGMPGFFTVGDAGVGTFTQTGGAVVAGQKAGDGYAGQVNQLFNMFIGNQANTAGSGGSTAPSTYSLTSSNQSSPASLTINGNLNLGVGTGAIGNMIIGTFASSPDATSLTVNNDPWNTTLGGNILIGVNGSSTLTQYNGNVTAANDIAIGVQTGSTGIYDMSGGTVTATNLEVGGSEIFTNPGGGGSGTFTQTGGLTTIGGWYGGQVLANGTTVPGASNGPGVLGTLIVGAQNSIALYELGTGGGGQTNTSQWVGYPGASPGVTPPAFDNVINAPYLQIYGNAILGAESSAATFLLAGDGSTLNINNVVGMSNQGTMVIGLNAGANGTFTQTEQSTVYLDGSVAIGLNDGATGTYNLSAGATSGGSLSVGGDLEIGGSTHVGDPIAQTSSYGGSGTFTQSAGDVTVQGNLEMGTNGDGGVTPGRASGIYNLSGGTLTVNNVGYFGNNGGTGTFNQTGGTAQFGTPTNSGGLVLGTTPLSGPASTGTYNISSIYDSVSKVFTSSSTLQVYGNVDLGRDTGTIGNMTIGTSGLDGLGDPTMVTVSSTGAGDGNLTVGDAGNGNLTIHSGTLNVASTTQLGVNGIGTVTQDGGVFNAGVLDLSVPAGTGSSTYNMTGGTLNVGPAGIFTPNADLNVAGSGTGSAVFNQGGTSNSGSTVNVGDTLFINNNGSNPGQYNISGPSTGANAVTLNVANNVFIGGGGGGQLSQTGGTVNIGLDTTASGSSGAQELELGFNAGDNGTYSISGGVLNAYGNAAFNNSAIEVGSSGTGLFTQTGGTVKTYGANGLAVGDCCGGSGEYDISGGSLNVLANPSTSGQSGNAFVGAHSTGVMTQSGNATVSINGDLNVGYESTGTYTLGGTGSLTVGVGGTGNLDIGTLVGGNGMFNYNVTVGDNANLVFRGTGQSLIIGDSGIGVFNEGSASHTTDLNLQASGALLDIGRSVGGMGTFNLAAGSSLEDDVIVGDAGTGVFNNTGATHTVGTASTPESLSIGNQSTGNGTYNLTAGGTTNVSSFTTVGLAGTGTFLNDASTHNTGELVLGEYGGASGTYTLQNGGNLNVGTSVSPGFFDVGEHGTGVFNQTSGTTTIYGPIDLGRCGGAGCLGTGDTDTSVGKGMVNLSGGSLSISQFAVVGDSGTGTFNQSGTSAVTVGTELDIGRSSGGFGTYNLSGGSITVSENTVLGDANGATGVVTQTGGTAQLNGSVGVILGNAAGSEGQYSLLGANSAALTIGGNLDIAAASGSSGSFYFNYDVKTGTPGGNATLSFSTPGSQLIVGDQGTGSFTQGGGDLNLAGSGVTLDIGKSAGSNGSYYLMGGTLEDDVIVGDAGSGLMSNTAGTHTVNGNLIIGNQSTGVGIYTLGGSGKLILATSGASITLGNNGGAIGTFNYNTSPGDAGAITFGTGQQIIVGGTGSGHFNQGGGDLNLTGAGVGLDIAQNMNSAGQYNLSGGTLEDSTLNVGDAGTGVLNNSGGAQTVTGNLVLGNKLTGNGTYNLSGTGTVTVTGNLTAGNLGHGTFSATGGTAQIDGNVNVSSNGLVQIASARFTANGNATNNGTIAISGGGNFAVNGNGTTTNNGKITVQNSTATFGGTFINNGAYISDPSVNNFVNLTIGPTGYLQESSGDVIDGPTDVFDISGNFLNNSTDTTDWNTSAATLDFTGTGGHTFDTTSPSTFSWGELDIASGNTLMLLSDLYVADFDGAISGDTVTDVFGSSSFDIFYNPSFSPDLSDLQYALEGGGCLTPIGDTPMCSGTTGGGPTNVPEPTTILIFAAGLTALASLRRKFGGPDRACKV